MSNITLALDPATYRTARVVAAERGLSVSALVREYLQSLKPAQSASEADAMAQMLEWAASTGQFSASQRLSRAEANDRSALRGA